MRLLIATILVILTLTSCAAFAVAQNSTDVPSKQDNQIAETKNYTALVTDIFAPITASLNLTKEQEFQIIAIIIATDVMTEPARQRLNEIEQGLVAASFADPFDEERVRALSEQEATILTQLIAQKVFAKAKIYHVLNPEQRMLVSQHFRPKAQLQGHLGAISIY